MVGEGGVALLSAHHKEQPIQEGRKGKREEKEERKKDEGEGEK